MDLLENKMEIETCLNQWSEGDSMALSRLIGICYQSDLLPLATFALRNEIGEMSPEDLVHLTWERLKNLKAFNFTSRGAFFKHVKIEMNRALLDQVRKTKARKRGGDLKPVDLEVCSRILDGTGGEG